MLIVVGDTLLDRDLDGSASRLAPDAPVPVIDAIAGVARAGGAGLAATLAGGDVRLVTALGGDDAADELRELLSGIEVVDLGLEGRTPEKVRVRAGGHPLVRLDYGESNGCGPLPAGALDGADAILVSDYGRGVAAAPSVRAALRGTVVWDPHPRGPEPVPGATLVTPNRSEATALTGSESVEDAARELLERWRAVAVCVTLGERGAMMVNGDGPPLAVPARPANGGDPCGAGDCFAATAASRLAAGALPSEAVIAAVEAASAFVAAGGAASVPARPPTGRFRRSSGAADLAARVRRGGGTVVATGGCFDLLHAGHVRMLQAARSLGDCLIVCLNSDASVRRLKGEDRPLVEQEDRAAVLNGLGCVDGVVIFEEDDPREVLRTLQPHLWVKGGDYAISELPEAETLAEWGGRAVLVPYVAGRSTTELIARAR